MYNNKTYKLLLAYKYEDRIVKNKQLKTLKILEMPLQELAQYTGSKHVKFNMSSRSID